MAKNIRLRSLFAVLFSVSIPMTYNACGKFESAHFQSVSSILSTPIQFERLSVPEATKLGFRAKGTCPKNLSSSIKVDQLAPVALECSTGAFNYDVVLSGSDGPKTIIISVVGVDGREYRDSLTVLKDTTVPTMTIINVAPQSNYVVISGTCESGLPISHGGNIQSISVNNCAQGVFQLSALINSSPGSKVLQLMQTDKAGNVGSAAYDWNPDITLPVLTVSSPLANAYLGSASTIAGSCEPGLPVLIGGTAMAQVQQVNCSSGTYSLNFNVNGADEAKTLIISQTDTSSNKTEVTVNVTKDTVAPNLTMSAPMESIMVTAGSVAVSGSCETGLPVMIQGSGVSAMVQAGCVSSAYTSNVTLTSGNGQKLIEVSQADKAGNTSKVSRTIFSTPPPSLLSILQPAANSLSKALVTLSGACNTGATLAFSGGITSTTNMTCAGGAYSKALTLSIGDGLKTVTVTQTLNGINSVASRSFTKDSTAPSISIAQPAVSALVEAHFIVSGSCETGLPVVLAGTGLMASVNATCTNGSFSATVSSKAGDGNKIFSATQTDEATNSASVSRTVVRDTSNPVLAVASPANNTVVGAMVTVTGSCEAGLSVQLSGVGLSQATAANCSLGMFSQAVTLSSGDGAKAISIKQTDLSGNMTTVNLNLTKDTMAPTLTIVSPAVGTQAEAGVTIKGGCENGLSVKAFGTGVSSEVTGACTAQAYSLNVTFSSGDGIKTVQLSQADTAGNTAVVSRQFEKAASPGAAFAGARTILNNYCVSCHKTGGSAAFADFTLTKEDEFVTRGYVIAGEPDKSRLIYRMLHYKGTSGSGATNMPMGYTASNFPISAYDTLVNWVKSIKSLPTNPPVAIGFSCTDPSLHETSLSYTLTKTQYVNSLKDLFGVAAVAAAEDSLSTLSEDNFNTTTNKRGSALSPAKIQAYFSVANVIAGFMTQDNSRITSVFGSCATAAAPAAACIDSYLNNFAKKIYRRPLTSEEMTFAKSIANRGGSYKANLKALLSYHLQSPSFIWRLELGKTSQASTAQTDLTPYEVASRISYMAADTIPDDALLAAAANNQLATPAQVQPHVRRMLATASGRDKTKRNLMRWSMNDKALDFATIPADLRQGLTISGLGKAMVDETSQYIDYMVYSQNASFTNLLTSKTSLASNASLAQIYGHAPVTSGTATMTGRRQGLLMRSPFFSTPSSRTGIIRRGVDFQKRMLCNEIPSPTSDIVDMRTDDELSAIEKLQYSNRDSITHQTKAQLCMSCHATINPTGFAFENLDPFGRLRTSEKVYNSSGQVVNTFPVNSSTEVPLPTGQSLPVQDAYDLVSYVATSDEGSACFARNAFRFINERREVAADDCELSGVHALVKDPNKSVLDALVELIGNNELFLKKN